MRLIWVAALLAPLALGACQNPTAATDCYYDKTASSAPGNLVCTQAPVISSEQSVFSGSTE